ncbi:MAG: hypothetical protein Q4E43_02775 [Akkermansia sp.]|nr:hypothetical protein [Akkermansia sp.]
MKTKPYCKAETNVFFRPMQAFFEKKRVENGGNSPKSAPGA